MRKISLWQPPRHVVLDQELAPAVLTNRAAGGLVYSRALFPPGLAPGGAPTSFLVHQPAAVLCRLLYVSLPCPNLRAAHFSNKARGSIASQTHGRRYQRLPFLSLTIRHRKTGLVPMRPWCEPWLRGSSRFQH